MVFKWLLMVAVAAGGDSFLDGDTVKLQPQGADQTAIGTDTETRMSDGIFEDAPATARILQQGNLRMLRLLRILPILGGICCVCGIAGVGAKFFLGAGRATPAQ